MSGILRTQSRRAGRWTRKSDAQVRAHGSYRPGAPKPLPPVHDPVERIQPAKVPVIKAAAAKVRATLRRLFGKRGA